MSNFAPKFTTKMNKTAQHIIDIENVSKRFLRHHQIFESFFVLK